LTRYLPPAHHTPHRTGPTPPHHGSSEHRPVYWPVLYGRYTGLLTTYICCYWDAIITFTTFPRCLVFLRTLIALFTILSGHSHLPGVADVHYGTLTFTFVRLHVGLVDVTYRLGSGLPGSYYHFPNFPRVCWLTIPWPQPPTFIYPCLVRLCRYRFRCARGRPICLHLYYLLHWDRVCPYQPHSPVTAPPMISFTHSVLPAYAQFPFTLRPTTPCTITVFHIYRLIPPLTLSLRFAALPRPSVYLPGF